MTDRSTVPNEACDHPVATHYHGTRACYTLDGCRCSDCQGARKRYDAEYGKTTGEFPIEAPRRVNAEPVRRHLKTLMDQGMGPKRIAVVSGVPHGAISKLIYGDYYTGRAPSKTISRKNAEILLELELDVADGAKVPKAEAVRIVDELVARGWSRRAIAQRIGNPEANGLQIGKGPTVQAGTLRDLRKLLDEPVPLRKHGPTGKMYRPNPDYEPKPVPATTRGVPSDWHPGSVSWLAEMRAGLKRAVEESIQRHGRVAA